MRLPSHRVRSGPDDEIEELTGKARQEVSRITRITGNALALQQQHNAWKET